MHRQLNLFTKAQPHFNENQELVGQRTMPFPVAYPETVGPGRLTEIASFRKSDISEDEVCIAHL